ncbi:MAG: hypothetical protein WDW36_008327 [Sanguina aurantia]
MGSSSGVINSGSGRRPGLPLLSGLRLARPVHRAASASATSQTTATPSRTGWSACGSAASSCARPSHAQHPCTHAASTARALHITTSAPDARQRPCRSSRSSTHAGSCGISGTTGSSSSSSSSSSRSSSTRGTPRAPSASALRRASSVHPHSSTARGVHPPTTTGAALPRSATSLEHGVAPGRCRAPSGPAHDRQRSSVSAQGSVDLGDLLLDDELVVGGLTPGQLGSYIQRGASSYSVQTDVGTPTRGGTGSSSSRPAATDRQRGSSAAGPVDNDLDDPPSLTPPGGSDGGGDGGGGGGSSSKGRMNGGSSSGGSGGSRPSADAAQPGAHAGAAPPRPLDPTQSADPDDAAQAALGEAPHAARPAPSSPGRPPHPRSTLAAIASITSLEQLDAVFRELSTAAPPPWPDTSTPPHTRDPRAGLHPAPAQGASSATAPLHSHTHTLTASTPPSATLAAGPAPLPAARVERVLLGCLDARHLSTLIYRLALLLPSPDQQQQQQQQHGSDGGHGPDGAAAAQLARQREQSLMRRLLRACVPLFRSFNPVDVTMLLNGVVIAGYVPQSSWLTPFLGHCLEALPRFGARNLAGVVWALAAMGASPGEAWMGRMCGCAEQRFAEFTPQALSLLLWAVARLQHTPSPAWLASWFAASAPLLPSSNAQNLAVSLWAVTRLTARQPSLPLSTAWLSQWHAASAARLPSFTGQGLSMLLWSHAQLNIPLQHQQPHAPGAQPPLGQDSPIPLTAPTGTAPGRAQPTSSSQPGAVSHPAGQPSGRTAPRLTLAEVLEAVTHQLHLMEPQHLAVTLWGVSVLAGHQDPAGACSASSPAGSPDGRQRAQGDGGHSADRGLRPVGAPSRDPRPDLPPQLPQPSGAPQQRQQRRRDSDAEASPQQPQQQLQQQLRFQLATLGSDEDSQRQQQQQPRQASSAAAQQQQQQQQQQGPDAAWVRRVASACEDVMSEFEPQGLAMVGRALSQLSYKANKKWMAAYLEVGSLPTRVGQMGRRTRSRLPRAAAAALAAGGGDPVSLELGAVHRVAVHRVHEVCRGADCVTSRGTPAATQKQMPHFTSRGLANVVWALAHQGFFPPRVLAERLPQGHLHAHAGERGPHPALPPCSSGSLELVDPADNRPSSGIASYDPTALAITLWSHAKVSKGAPVWWSQAALYAIASAATASASAGSSPDHSPPTAPASPTSTPIPTTTTTHATTVSSNPTPASTTPPASDPDSDAASTAPEQQQQQQQGVQASTALSRAQPGQPNSSSPPAAAVPGVAIKPEELAMMMWSVGKLEFVPGSITWVHQVEAAALRQLPRQHHHLGSTPASDSGHPPDASSDSGHPVDSSSDSGHPVDSSSDSGHPVDSSSDSGRPVDSSSDSGRPVTLDLASHVPASVSQAAAVLRPQHVCSMLYCFARIHAPCPAFLLAATEWMLSHQAQSELRRSGGALPLLHARHGPGLNGSSGVTAGRNGAGVGGSSRNGADSSTDSSTSSSTSSSLVHRSSDRSSSSLVDRSSNRSTSSSNSSNGSSNRSNSSSDSSSGGGGGGGRGVAVPAGLSSRDVAMWLWACASLGHDPRAGGGRAAGADTLAGAGAHRCTHGAGVAPTARHRCMTGRVADRLVGVFFPSEKVRGMADTRAVQQWVSWAVLRLGIVPPPAWVDALAARFYATLPLASLLTLSTLLRSLLALGYVPTRAWVVAVRAGSDQCMKRCTQSKRKRGLLWEAVLLQLKGLSEVARTGVGNASSDWPPRALVGTGRGGGCGAGAGGWIRRFSFRGPAGPGPGAPGGAVSGPAPRRGGRGWRRGSWAAAPARGCVEGGWGGARGRAWERGAERAHTVAAECAFQSVAPGACESQQAGWCRAKAT